MSIIQQFTQQAVIHPEKAAIIFEEQVLSYQQLAAQVVAFSSGLLSAGVKSGDHIAVLLPNRIEFVVLMLAAANIGVVLVPHNPSLNDDALSRAAKAADIDHFIVWYALIADLKNVREQSLSKGALWVSVGGEYESCLSFDALLQTTNNAGLGEVNVLGSATYILTMTSGSTGDPKPIVLSQETKEARAQAAINLYELTETDLVLVATPMYHSLAQRLVLMPLLIGASCVLMAGYSAKNWIKVVNENALTFSIIVSSQLKQILSELKQQPVSLNSLRCLVSSSERLPESVRLEMTQFFNCDFHECYGASEIAIATNLDHQLGHGNSVGTAIPGVDIKILSEAKAILKSGEAGEIVCKTPMLFSGYYKQPEVTKSSMWGEYFCTGDLGCLDDKGYLSFLGRKKDIIITGGINIYPKDIEDVLNANPCIMESAVIGLEDESLGEKITAVIVFKAGQTLTVRELQRLCAIKLADFQQPRHYIMTESLPKSPMGKVMKQSLIKRFSA